jgi:penicillin-binding protein-related factor A (putative recombinase)
MKAKEFEEVCLYRLRQEEKLGRATMGRYGVQASFRDGKWEPIQSLPDFEGVLPPRARHFTFDCKVCGKASFPLDESKFKRRQLKHLLLRNRFGAITFLLIHFTERKLKKSIEPEATWAFPVGDTAFWQAFDRGECKSISRADCEEYAVRVAWNVLPGGRTPRPDIVSAIGELMIR